MRCEPCSPPPDGAFVFHLLWGTTEGLRRKSQEGSKVSPWRPSLVNVPCCSASCAASGIKTRMGVIGFNKWNDDHFQNGWHWLNETELLFFFWQNSSPLWGIAKCACEWKRESGCKEMWKCLEMFEEWITSRSENTSALGQGVGGVCVSGGVAESRSDFSGYPSCFQSQNILQFRHECGRVMTCERVSDRVTALRQRDWDRGRWGMGERGEGGEGGGNVWLILTLCSPQATFLNDWAVGMYIKYNLS